MKHVIGALAVAALIGYPAVALSAPDTVAAALDAGGRKLTKDEVTRLFYGATVTGIQAGRPDIQFEIKTSPDGSVNGKAWGAASFTMVTGRWSVNDSGQYCGDLRNSVGGIIAGCSYYFLVGNRYYAAKTDARSEPILERQFRR